MGNKVYGSPFAIDWNDELAVIAYAKRLGAGNVVYKVSGRKNFNITHASRFFRHEVSDHNLSNLVYHT